MMWKCPKLFRYWEEVVAKINKTFKTKLEAESKICLLGSIEENRVPASSLEVVLRCLFQARKLIALRWQAQIPPTAKSWVETINTMIWSERVTLTRQGNYRKFVRMWKP